MAKKKGRRSINVARKREKRNRDRKSRQKQLAVEKQRRLLYEKSEEEHLHACISQSRQLLDEPELEGVLFDFELMYKWITESLSSYEGDRANTSTYELEDSLESEEDPVYPTNTTISETVTTEEQPNFIPEAERACEHFQLEVLPHLVTPDFIQRLGQALIACETRLKLTGNRELAEVASVTHSLFEKAPPEILVFHPMIQTIGIETLRVLVEEPDIIDGNEEVKGILSDVLEYEDSEAYESQPSSLFSDTVRDSERSKEAVRKSALTELASLPSGAIGTEDTDVAQAAAFPTQDSVLSPDPVESAAPSTSEIVISSVSPDKLPARALYKNFDGLGIKSSFKEQIDDASLQEGLTNYALVNESEKQVEFVDVENERYITVTEERLQLHARSETELTIAMAEVEAQCTSAVMYLAKMIEERG